MTFRWRIRHKLLLGLAMVVSTIVLLLAGTLFGLASFRNTFKSIDRKHTEFKSANTLRTAVTELRISAADTDNLPRFEEKVEAARKCLSKYKDELDLTLTNGRDPELGQEESSYIKLLGQFLDQLTITARHVFEQPVVASMEAKAPSPLDHPAIKDLLTKLCRTSDDLVSVITEHLNNRSTDASATASRTEWIVLVTGVLGVLLLCSLLRTFYRSLYGPIRALETGAIRLAQGNFEHRIEVHTGDELEDLANSFNTMTGRLRDMYSDLARQVNERSRQLVRSERLASVGFLAAGVAHEINNPLASIAFCSEALEHRLTDVLKSEPKNAEVINKYLRMIQTESFRCKEITKRLLEFSRGGERRREPTDLGDLIQGVLDMAQLLQNGKGKQIVFRNPGKLMASVNAQEIKQVVLNVVVNALDSMEEGGTLTIGLAEKDGMAEMVFKDTGCGMPPDVLENIFEPFYTRSRTGKGTGLGLSISHQVISQHGGEIEAVSPGVNQGSTFTVRLPLQPAEPVKEEALVRAAA